MDSSEYSISTNKKRRKSIKKSNVRKWKGRTVLSVCQATIAFWEDMYILKTFRALYFILEKAGVSSSAHDEKEERK